MYRPMLKPQGRRAAVTRAATDRTAAAHDDTAA